MNTREKDGATAREHLEKAADGFIPNKEAIEKLKSEPELPHLAVDAWVTFQKLSSRREYNENGPVRFSYENIWHYSQVTGHILNAWMLKTIFALDDTFFIVRFENEK